MSTFDQRVSLDVAMQHVGYVVSDFDATTWLAGSTRRALDDQPTDATIGDLDLIVVQPENAKDFHDVLCADYLRVTKKKAHGWHQVDGVRMMVDAWLVPPESLGPFGFFLTGPLALNVVMRQISQSVGLMLTQYGLFVPEAAPTKTYPDRVKPGPRMDSATENRDLTLQQCEEEFWDDWCEAVGLKNSGWPRPRDREEVMRWLQGRSRATRLGVTSRG
jgi:hypothetical protein